MKTRAPTPLRSRPTLRKGQVLSLDELDQLLDVPVSRFDKTVARLIREMTTKEISIDVPHGRDVIASAPLDSRVSWRGVYEAQVYRLAQMDRASEFLMARRYDFMRQRAICALRTAGFSEEEIPEVIKRGPDKVGATPRKLGAKDAAHLDRALRELEALRNHYVETSLYMVFACAQRYRNLGVDFADLIQEGNASLFQAIDGFDWRRDVRFKTYAQYWINQAILKVLYNSSRTVRVPIWVQKTLGKINKVRDRCRQPNGEPATAETVGKEMGITADRVNELLATKRYAVSLDAEVGSEDGTTSLSNLLPDERIEPVEELIEDGDLGARLDQALAELPEREQMILERRFGLHGRPPETLGQIAVDLGVTAERVRQLQKIALGRLQRPVVADRLKAFAL